MSSKHLFLAAFVLATSLVSATSANFDHYMLSLRWPPSLCSYNPTEFKCVPEKKPKNEFTIHGLWPEFANGDAVLPYDEKTNPCNKSPVPPAQLPLKIFQIQDKLRALWPDYREKTSYNYKFYIPEWEKHGMCSDYPQDPMIYFQAALDLAGNSKYNYKVMALGGSDTAENVLKKMKEKLGKTPLIRCQQRTSDKKYLLFEVRYCFERANPLAKPTVLIDCPNRPISGCGGTQDTIVFPAVSSMGVEII